MLIEIGEFTFAEPAYRKRARIVAKIDDRDESVRFALQYQHDGEPGAWLPDPSFPWHGRNFDSIIRAATQYHEKIENVLKRENEIYDHD